jgi:hypothetical protein
MFIDVDDVRIHTGLIDLKQYLKYIFSLLDLFLYMVQRASD